MKSKYEAEISTNQKIPLDNLIRDLIKVGCLLDD